MIQMFPSDSITLQFAVKRHSQRFGFTLQILGLIFLWVISQQTALTTAGSLMIASQANQTPSLNTLFYIAGPATRSWLLRGTSFSKTSKRHKSSISTSSATNKIPLLLKEISFLALDFPTILNHVRCYCLPPTYQYASWQDVAAFQPDTNSICHGSHVTLNLSPPQISHWRSDPNKSLLHSFF